jgi:hypothetical protein
MTITPGERLLGRDTPPTELRWLRAGPLDVALDGADLRYVRLGAIELVRRLYVAVRTVDWGTIPETERDVSVEATGDSFLVTCRVRHVQDPFDFVWNGRFEGQPDGTISYAGEGRCQSRFQFARIGICLHHPSLECAGRPFSAMTTARRVTGVLPLDIGPQLFDHETGYDLPLFDACSALSIELSEDIGVDFTFDGDLFEMEDQRNWTDASFKSFSTPTYLGVVHQAEPGRVVAQRVQVAHRAPGVTKLRRRRSAAPANVLTLGEPLEVSLPPIGFGLPSDGEPHTEHEQERVRALRPSHLRADIDAEDPDALDRALEQCELVDTSLELALHVDPSKLELDGRIRSTLGGARVARVVVIERGGLTTARGTIELARRQLPPAVALVGGTDLNFCDINRDRPDVSGLAGIAYSINSQVHAFDELSLVEAIAGHGDTARSARGLWHDTPIIVTPVTLRPRREASARNHESPLSGVALPADVDPRQMSMFAAVWSLGSVKALSEAGVSSLTYYETVGWRGLFERERGNPQPSLFPSTPRMLYPAYELFSELTRHVGDGLVDLVAAKPLEFVGLALRCEDHIRILVGNLTAAPIVVDILPLGLKLALEPYGLELLSA